MLQKIHYKWVKNFIASLLFVMEPVNTFKQIEEESLSFCNLYDLLLVWCNFFL